MTIPERIVVFGRPGSGKTTLARSLSQITHLPIYHLDKIRWKYEHGRWLPLDEEESYEHYKIILNHNQWIIDGNYIETLPNRCRVAHRIVYINVPRWKCFIRILLRSLKGERLNLNWGFIKYLWKYDKLIKKHLAALKLDDRYIEIRN